MFNLLIKAGFLISLLLSSYALVSCDNDNTPTKHKAPPLELPKPTDPVLKEALDNFYEAQVQAITQTSQCINELSTEVNSFFPTPDQQTLSIIQERLERCIILYAPTYTLLQHMDNQELSRASAAIYSIPIMPGYVDYLQHYPNSGIVNDVTVPITKESLRNQQGLTDSGEISIGFEVIAFLLAGEQRYNSSLPVRPLSDFVAPQDSELLATLVERRQNYLLTAIALLQEDILALNNMMKRVSKSPLLTPSNQQAALRSLTNILKAMHKNILTTAEPVPQHHILSQGYWQLLNGDSSEKAAKEPQHSTLSAYLGWQMNENNLSNEAFATELQTVIQRLNDQTKKPSHSTPNQ